MSHGVHARVLASSILALLVASTACAQNAAVTVNVDAHANRHAISPLIYGVAYGSTAEIAAQERIRMQAERA